MSDPQHPNDQARSRFSSSDDTEAFPGNWVELYGDYSTDGIWSAGGLCNSADNLPITADLKRKIENWGFNYVGRHHPGGIFHEAHGKWFDEMGLPLAHQLKLQLPHWTVVFTSEFNVYSTPSGAFRGAIAVDGAFVDLTEEQIALQNAIRACEHWI